MDVIERAKRGWHRWKRFKEIEPGHRFQTRYRNHRQRRERGETWKYGRIFNAAGGPALIAAGFAFVPTPGPSYIIIVIGLWMLVRELGRWIKATWADSSGVARALLVLTIVLCAAALGYELIT